MGRNAIEATVALLYPEHRKFKWPDKTDRLLLGDESKGADVADGSFSSIDSAERDDRNRTRSGNLTRAQPALRAAACCQLNLSPKANSSVSQLRYKFNTYFCAFSLRGLSVLLNPCFGTGNRGKPMVTRVAGESASFVKRHAPMLIRCFAIYNKLGGYQSANGIAEGDTRCRCVLKPQQNCVLAT